MKNKTTYRPIQPILATLENTPDPESQYQLAMIHVGYAPSPESDFETAIPLFISAANHGHVEAQTRLGLMYLNGWGLARDEYQAADWFYKAALAGDDVAQCVIGTMYAMGLVFKENMVTAIEWLEKSAQQDHPEAIRNLDYAYRATGYLSQGVLSPTLH